MMKENSNEDILLGVRLALKRGEIAEAEHHVVTRDEIHLENLIKPRPGLVEDIAPEDKTPRQQMLDIGLSYYDALTGEDGTLAPFALNVNAVRMAAYLSEVEKKIPLNQKKHPETSLRPNPLTRR
ncbi:MAG: hypothetical protein P8Z37_15435 [Acidobacteriota bacterium]